MTVFSYTWDATFLSQPSDGEDINLGANRIRLFKAGLTERLVVDHSWAGDANDGKHNAVTLKAAPGIRPVENDDGYLTNIVIGGISELHWVNDVGQVVRITNQGSVNPTFPGDGTFSGTLTVTDLTATSQVFFGNDAQFYGTIVASNPTFNFDPNTYIHFNRVTRKFVFVVDGVTVVSFPA